MTALIFVYVVQVSSAPHDHDSYYIRVSSDFSDRLLPDGNDTIMEGSDVKKDHLATLLMSFILRHKLSAAASQDLLSLLNIMIPGCVPTSNYYMQKYFGFDMQYVEVHHYCSACLSYFGKQIDVPCTKCGAVSDPSSNSYMLVLPLQIQLKQMLSENSWESYMSSSNPCDDSVKSDVNNGSVYRELRKHCQLTLQFNCDGAPLFNSSAFSIWPILCTINELPVELRNSHPFLHTIWFGRQKPRPDTYLQPFVSEMSSLYTDGMTYFSKQYQTEQHIYVGATLCICDAPARAMVQNFMQYNGQFGCGFCYHEGKHVKKGDGFARVYPMTAEIPEKRTHEHTIELATLAVQGKKPSMGVHGPSLLCLLPSFDIIRSFVPDYMHCALLGVTKQFMNIWTDGANRFQEFHLNASMIDPILMSVCPPDEIHRLPRTMTDRAFWKASEYRNFLLVYSPIVLMNALPKKYFFHWMLFVNGVSLLCSKNVTVQMLATSRDCLTKFVLSAATLYGEEIVSYNIHILTHLPDAVAYWGPLWSNSAFVFEGIIGFLKACYHGTQHVPKQLFNTFCIWRNVQQLSILFSDANDDVKYMFEKLTNCSQRVKTCVAVGSFVGLGKPVCHSLTLAEQLAVQNSGIDHNQCNGSPRQEFDSYDHFIISGTVYSTQSYSGKFKRDNSLISIGENKFGYINSCFVTRNCSPAMSSCKCLCVKECIIFVRQLQTMCLSHNDTFVNFNTLGVINKVVDEHELIAIAPRQILAKCVSIAYNKYKYVMKLPVVDNN